ncbi:pilus assembly protein [Amphiplicatus metriothermophilus]|uniref:Flp pilus assembly protein TadG n=1 Tax=Amphiplicatus metriothermophilus TaxID=1519374 RepID=A0A239PP68_9PROT|nr:TadE/TadG family type IV pilus assembly protein [Amphiplicatus metriothermophilus]MBB5518897.1 Flp pilus assembly protein TadG [Amphiplicatus metriothermophilus]SNT71950.1 Flp pilus assembly protein TadG [Amphiplicatus metriothermophilus]
MTVYRNQRMSRGDGCAARRDGKLKRRIRRFAAARDGNIAIMFVFMLGALMLFVGGAVDFTRYNMVRADLVESMDAAGLAMAQIDALNGPEIQAAPDREEYLKQQGRKFFYENFKHANWVEDLNIDFELTSSTITPKAAGRVRTLFLHIGEMLQSGGDKLTYLNLNTETQIVRRDDGNIEVAMVMDITGSMSGQRIADLKAAAKEMIDIVVRDDQSEWYSKAALIPYSMGVNVGGYANQIRGSAAGPIAITNIARADIGSPVNITNIRTDYNPVRVYTSSSQGFSNGDTVCIEDVDSSGYGSNKLEDQVNDKAFTVSNVTSSTFRLDGVNGSSWSGSYQSGGVVRECKVIVTASGHGFSTDDYVHINGVVGVDDVNNNTTNSCPDANDDDVCDGKAWRIEKIDNNTFALKDLFKGVRYDGYVSGGSAWCTVPGCEYHLFPRASDGRKKIFQITTCVSERVGSQVYTDAPPSIAYVGRIYKGSENTCPAEPIVPLSTDKAALKASIDAYNAAGSTAGQIGIAWGWYMISPNFGYLFPSESVPAPYDDDETTKVVVIMTDGEFNTPYCQGVIAKNAASGSGSSANKINCDATNGDPYAQALSLCSAMKDEGVVVYTIGFDISSSAEVTNLLTNCASGPDNVYFAATGDELRDIYRAIGSEITKLHISK